MRRAVLGAALLALSVAPVHAQEDAPEADPPVDLGTALRVARVRLTHYWESGRTYSGGHTFIGSAACSWNYRLGTRFVLPSGETFVCTDRGRLGASGWLDLYGVNRDYLGPYVTVEVRGDE